jgi:uncharacterized membrane protein YsdA (DUF1294 family)
MAVAAAAWLYLIMSFAALVAYAYDKRAAMQGQGRIPENTLHLISLLGGWPGAFLAQQAFRHKTSKGTFQLAYWATVLVNSGVFVLFVSH